MKKKILVVEDNATNMYLVRFILQKAGYEVVEAVNGEQGVQKAITEMPDLILMDMQLPVMNGYEATKQIKQFKPNMPIIAQTAYAIAGDYEKALEAGCDDYISKPIKKKLLMEKIEKHVKF